MIQRHKGFKQRKQDEVVRQCGGNTHHKAGGDTGNPCCFLGFVAFINSSGSDHIGSTHQKVGNLSDASRGGGHKLQCVFDKFNEQTGERPEGKCTDECRKIGQIHPCKGRRQRHRKFHKSKHICHCRKQCGHGDGSDIEGGSFFRLLQDDSAVHNAPLRGYAWI